MPHGSKGADTFSHLAPQPCRVEMRDSIVSPFHAGVKCILFTKPINVHILGLTMALMVYSKVKPEI